MNAGEPISYSEVMPMLAHAARTYRESPEAATVDRYDGDYIHVAQFVRYLIRLRQSGMTDDFQAIFDAVERVLIHGDHDARTLVQAGFIEGLTNLNLFNGATTSPAEFLEWMGPHTLKDPYVRELYEPRPDTP